MTHQPTLDKLFHSLLNKHRHPMMMNTLRQSHCPVLTLDQLLCPIVNQLTPIVNQLLTVPFIFPALILHTLRPSLFCQTTPRRRTTDHCDTHNHTQTQSHSISRRMLVIGEWERNLIFREAATLGTCLHTIPRLVWSPP